MRENKTLKITAFFISLIILLLTLTSCNNSNGKTPKTKWVLTSETWYSEINGETTEITEYEYDKYGRLIAEKGQIPNYMNYTSFNFKYDENGNVIYKLRTYTSLSGDKKSETKYNYTYDDNNNCISKEEIASVSDFNVEYDSDNELQFSETPTTEYSNTIYTYNEYDNIINENYSSSKSSETIQYNCIYKHTYENENCIQSEKETKYYENGVYVSTSYDLEVYTYDANGNLIKNTRYYEADESDNNTSLQVNDKNYKIATKVSYTWKEIEILSLSEEQQINTKYDTMSGATTETISETTTKNIKLSKDYHILSTGHDSNGNFYELVASQKETATTVKIEIGVIANNEWLHPLSSNHPFIDKKTGLMLIGTGHGGMTTAAIDSFLDYYSDSLDYIGNGWFINGKLDYRGDNLDNNYEVTNGSILYNAKNNKYYKFIDSNSSFGEWYILPPDNRVENNVDKDNILIFNTGHMSVLNTNDMTKTNWVNSYVSGYRTTAYSNGMFYGESSWRDEKGCGFYSVKTGKKVLDIPYNLVQVDYQLGIIGFSNGNAVLDIWNQAGNKYQIVIDTFGNIISETPID